MADLGFVRNESARQLRAGHSSTLGLRHARRDQPVLHRRGAGHRGRRRAQRAVAVILQQRRPADARSAATCAQLEQQRVQGILITPVDPDDAELDEIARRGTPVVFVDRDRARHASARSRSTTCSAAGSRSSTSSTSGTGGSPSSAGPVAIGQVRDRRAGARRAVHAGRAAPPTAGRSTRRADRRPRARGAGRPDRRRLPRRAPARPPAFCANDLLALGLLQQCGRAGVRVPGDLASSGTTTSSSPPPPRCR